MKEILGNDLDNLFKIYEGKRIYKGEEYEVWEMSDEVFNKILNMTEDSFVEMCPDGWWRYDTGCNLGIPYHTFIINGKEMTAWDGYERQHWYEDCVRCEDGINGLCPENEEDWEECCKPRKYKSLTEYMCNEIGVSLPRNVVALAVDLAKYNNMSMAELFATYEGE